MVGEYAKIMLLYCLFVSMRFRAKFTWQIVVYLGTIHPQNYGIHGSWLVPNFHQGKKWDWLTESLIPYFFYKREFRWNNLASIHCLIYALSLQDNG